MGFSPHPQVFPQRFEERGKVHTWWEQQKKEGPFLVKRRIQVYNSGRQFNWTLFCIKGFSSKKLFE